MSPFTLVSLLLLALLVFWAVGAYNRLIRLKNAIATAFPPMDVQLKRRDALLGRLVDLTQQTPQLGAPALDGISSARHLTRHASEAVLARPVDPVAVDALSTAEQALVTPLGDLVAAWQAHPDAAAAEPFRAMREDLLSTDHTLAFARQTYNDAADEYNQAKAQFPTVVLARLFAFAPAAAFKNHKAETECLAESEPT